MRNHCLTQLELDVLHAKVGDVERQVTILTGMYHGVAFTSEELDRLKQIASLTVELSLAVTLLRRVWKDRVQRGEESNRSVAGGTDAAGPARPGDDVPPGSAR